MIDLNSVALPIIVTIVYVIIDLIKTTLAPYQNAAQKISHFYPLIAIALGVTIAAIMFYAVPDSLSTTNLLIALVIGAASGLTAVGTNQVVKQLSKTADGTTPASTQPSSTQPTNNDSNSNAANGVEKADVVNVVNADSDDAVIVSKVTKAKVRKVTVADKVADVATDESSGELNG